MRALVIPIVCAAVCFLPSCPPVAASPAPSTLIVAARQLYNSQFELSRQTLRTYSVGNPEDPLAYSLVAASYLFSTMNRMGAMQVGSVFDEDTAAHRTPLPPDAKTDQEVQAATAKALEAADAVLKKDPNNHNALLAGTIAAGVQRDYLAVVEHRYRDSYDSMKQSEAYAARLLQIDPHAYDAYFTRGFTEYLVGSMPFFLRWAMKIDGLVCTKEQGLRDLQIAADRGEYLKPFAKLMLAMFYLREKERAKTEQLLAQLSRDFPANPAFRRQLEKVRLQLRAD